MIPFDRRAVLASQASAPPERPPVVAPSPAQPPSPARAREGFKLAEWLVGVGLLVGSLPGPWLTIGLPTAALFAFHDRRAGARVAALALLAASALLALAAPGGAALLLMAVCANVAAAVWVARGRSGALDALALPTIGGAGVGWGLAQLATPTALAAWEAMLERAVADGGEAALARYRQVGLDPAALAALEGALTWLAEWTVRLWPALAVIALWFGAWLAGRLVARWGRIAPDLGRRFARQPFATFAVGEAAAWILILGLAGLWVPAALVERAAANAGIVAVALFMLDGLAVVWWWLERRRVSAALGIVVVVLAIGFALPLAGATLLALGLVDLWVQFRKRAHNR